MQIQTAPNILTTIEVPLSGYNVTRTRWEIMYSISKTNLIEGITSSVVANRTISILDTPETPILDGEGNQTGITPATTDLTDFVASWSTIEELTDASFVKVIEREQIVEWDGSTITEIEDDPDAAIPAEWSELIGQLVAPPNKVIHNEVVYDVLTPHTVQAQFAPPMATLYSVSPEQPNGRPAWEQGTYADVGTEVTHNGKVWSNRRANNNQGFAPATAGSGWMEIQEDGTLEGDWYNLGSEGYAINYKAHYNGQCWLNPNNNTHWEPGVAVWTQTPC